MSKRRVLSSRLRFLWATGIKTINNKQKIAVCASLSYTLPCTVLLLFRKTLPWILSFLLNQRNNILRFGHLYITPFKDRVEKVLFQPMLPLLAQRQHGFARQHCERVISKQPFTSVQPKPSLAQMKGSCQKPIHFLAISTWNQVTDSAA